MKRSVVGGVVIILLVGAACWPVTTRSGLNYQVTTRRITLFEKAVHFLSRDLQTRRLVAEMTRGARGADERLLRLFEWAVAHVRATPAGFPVVDDHPWHILIRGSGAPDQRTEAFALLASYAGFPAAAASLTAVGTDARLIVAAVRTGPRTLVFDVNHDLIFRNARGECADWKELVRDPALVRRVAGELTVEGEPYEHFFQEAGSLTPRFDRMEAQKPWARLWQELGHLLTPRAREVAP